MQTAKPNITHNPAMITDRRKFTIKWSLYGIFSLYYVGINNQSHSPYKKPPLGIEL